VGEEVTITTRMRILLWATLAVYVVARICQMYADRLPALLIVVLHVDPPAVFALVHGSMLYRRRGILVFTLLCLDVAGFLESLSLRTGVPFGSYSFTDVMGPKLSGLPILLVLAYLGMAYCSWVMSLLITGTRKPMRGLRAVMVPLLASFVMLAWDLAMEADWSTVDRAWIWRDGGPFFGVPVSNFFGWYVTAFVYFLGFALYCRSRAPLAAPVPRIYWRAAIFLYAVCALGNLLILRLPMAAPIVFDASGKAWITAHILRADALVSIFLMGFVVVLAWRGLDDASAGYSAWVAANSFAPESLDPQRLPGLPSRCATFASPAASPRQSGTDSRAGGPESAPQTPA
jgi:putative membrane protein